MRLVRRVLYVTALTGLSVGCDLFTGPDVCDPLGLELVIGVSLTNKPEFHWIPDCTVSSLEVALVENIGGTVSRSYPIWKLSKTGNSGIESGVVFGEAPPDTEELCGNPSWELYSWDIPKYVSCGEGPGLLVPMEHYSVTIKSSVPYSGWLGSGHRRETWTQVFVPTRSLASH